MPVRIRSRRHQRNAVGVITDRHAGQQSSQGIADCAANIAGTATRLVRRRRNFPDIIFIADSRKRCGCGANRLLTQIHRLRTFLRDGCIVVNRQRAIVLFDREARRTLFGCQVAVSGVRIEQTLFHIVVVRVLLVEHRKFLNRRLPVVANRLLSVEIQHCQVALPKNIGIVIAKRERGIEAFARQFDLPGGDCHLAAVRVCLKEQVAHFSGAIIGFERPQLLQPRDRIAPLFLRDQVAGFVEECCRDSIFGCRWRAAGSGGLHVAQFLLGWLVARIVA